MVVYRPLRPTAVFKDGGELTKGSSASLVSAS